jgi:hypothetical protein
MAGSSDALVINPQTIGRLITKLNQETDQDLVNLSWDTFSSAVPSSGLNATHNLDFTVLWLKNNLVDLIDSAGEKGVEVMNAIKEIALKDQHAIDVHLACVVAGFVAHFIFKAAPEIPLGDLAAMTLLTIRTGVKILGKL